MDSFWNGYPSILIFLITLLDLIPNLSVRDWWQEMRKRATLWIFQKPMGNKISRCAQDIHCKVEKRRIQDG